MAELQKPRFQEENSRQAALPVRGGVGKGVPGHPAQQPLGSASGVPAGSPSLARVSPARELLPSDRPASGRPSLCFTDILPPRPLDFLFSRGM